MRRIVEAGYRVMANRVLASMRKLLGWSVEHGLLDRSPCDGLRALGKVRSRDRVLTDPELRAVWNTCGQLNEPWPGLLRLLIASGRRRGEVAGMKWEHLDIDKVWSTIPPELARNGRPHNLPVAPLMDIIGKRRAAAGEPTASYVFAHTRSRGRAPSGFSDAMKQLDKLSGVTGWRVRDIRRTVVTQMAEANILPHVIEAMVNHVSGSKAGVAGV